MSLDLIVPEWPAPANVRALITTRRGGLSLPPFDSLNLGTHVGDSGDAVLANRARLRRHLPAEPVWLEQVHGTNVHDADGTGGPARADASVAHRPGVVCAVMTADCLPVLFCDDAGSVVGAAHAGWRGLAAGVLEATVARMGVAPERILAWLGPAIGAGSFEVGSEVREAFLASDPGAAEAFVGNQAPDKWLADIYMLARRRLVRARVARVYGGGLCTVEDRARFFSYRRDGETGRFASMVWRASE